MSWADRVPGKRKFKRRNERFEMIIFKDEINENFLDIPCMSQFGDFLSPKNPSCPLFYFGRSGQTAGRSGSHRNVGLNAGAERLTSKKA